MKWINGLINKEDDPRKEWHTWFAWFPVIIGNTTRKGGQLRHEKCWLEYVERKGTYHPPFYFDDYGTCWTWKYRELK